MYKIIIVDDEELLRQGFIHMTNWSEHDFEIIYDASNGKEALEAIEETSPDIIITDIRMPVMDGIELTRIVKEKYPHIQVIVLSSFDDFDYVRETLKLGALDYLLKPKMDHKSLLKILENAKAKINKMENNITLSVKISDNGLVPIEIDYDLLDSFTEKLDFNRLNVAVKQMITEYITQNSTIDHYSLTRIFIDLFYYLIHKLDSLGLNTEEISKYKFVYINSIENTNTIDELFSTVDNIFIEISNFISAFKEHNYSTIVIEVIQYIEDNYQDNITLSSIADNFHINKSYLCTLFKQQTEDNLSEWITNYRIEKAKTLLRQSKHNVNMVSNMVGYSNPSYFGKVFKRIVKITPFEYHKLFNK